MIVFCPPGPDEITLAISALAVAGVFPWAGNLRRLTQDRAIEHERRKRLPPPPERSIVDTAGTLARLDGENAVLFGSDMAGNPIRVRREIAVGKSGLVLGASGSGKTRWVISVVLALVSMMAAGLPLDILVIDTKGETVDLLERWIAHLLLTWPEERAQWLRRHVKVGKWRRDAVTPLQLYDNRGGQLSESYVAAFRTEVTTEAGSSEYTDATRHLRFMHDQLLAHLGMPLNQEFAIKFYLDPAFRAAIARQMRSPHLRAWAESLALTLPKMTILAFLRRLERELADPIMRVAKGLPPADAQRLVPPQEPGITLVRAARDTVLSTTVAQELALHTYVETLNAVPLRDPRRLQLVVAEELAATLAGAPKLKGHFINTLRTARSFGTAVLGLAQDLENAAQTETVKAFPEFSSSRGFPQATTR